MYGKKVKFFIEVIIHALFWLGAYYALQALTDTSYKITFNNNGRTMFTDGRTLFPYVGLTVGLLMLLFYGSIFWLFRKERRKKNRGLDVAVIIGWLVLLYGLNYKVVRVLMGETGEMAEQHKLIPNNPSGPPPPPPPMSFSVNDWNHMQPVLGALFLIILSVAVAYAFIREGIRSDLRRSKMEAQQLDTEIKFLRAQVNPHFLFNTLNNLFSMAQRRGDEELADGISKLSGMMRYMIHESDADRVSLAREIAYLEDCIALNKLRYAESEVSISFRRPEPGETARIQIAPMLFVSFLENAFKHGVSIGHHSSITMAIAVDSQKLIFTCVNTDHSAVKKPIEVKSGIGLENVRRRLQLLYPGRYQLKAGTEGGEFRVNLQIVLI